MKEEYMDEVIESVMSALDTFIVFFETCHHLFVIKSAHEMVSRYVVSPYFCLLYIIENTTSYDFANIIGYCIFAAENQLFHFKQQNHEKKINVISNDALYSIRRCKRTEWWKWERKWQWFWQREWTTHSDPYSFE